MVEAPVLVRPTACISSAYTVQQIWMKRVDESEYCILQSDVLYHAYVSLVYTVCTLSIFSLCASCAV